MSAPRAVTFVNHVGWLGGAERSLLILLANLDRGRFAPTLVCPPGELATAAAGLELPWRAWPGYDARRRLQTLPALLRASHQLRPLLADADLVHANSFAAGLAAALVCRPNQVLVWHRRDLRLPRLPAAWLAQQAQAVIVLSPHHDLRANPRVHVLPNALDPATFWPARPAAAVRAEFGVPPEAPLVICVGALIPWKGHNLLLDAFCQVLGTLRDARLLVVGADPSGEHTAHVAALQQRSSEPPLAGRVVWAGQRNDVADLIAAADVLALPSDHEPFGRVLLEAAAVRRPVVATDLGGPRAVVVPGETGLLVLAEPAAFAAALVAALTLPSDEQAAMGQRAYDRLVARYSPQQQAMHLAALYDQLLARTGL